MTQIPQSYVLRRHFVWRSILEGATIRTAVCVDADMNLRVGVGAKDAELILFPPGDAYRLANYLVKKARPLKGAPRIFLAEIARNLREAAADATARKRDMAAAADDCVKPELQTL